MNSKIGIDAPEPRELDRILGQLEAMHKYTEELATRLERVEARFFASVPRPEYVPEFASPDTCIQRLDFSLAFILAAQSRISDSLRVLETL